MLFYACDVKDCNNFETVISEGTLPQGWSIVETGEGVDEKITGVFDQMLAEFAPPEGVTPLRGDESDHIRHILRDHIRPYVKPFGEMMQSAFRGAGVDLRRKRHICQAHAMPWAFEAESPVVAEKSEEEPSNGLRAVPPPEGVA